MQVHMRIRSILVAAVLTVAAAPAGAETPTAASTKLAQAKETFRHVQALNWQPTRGKIARFFKGREERPSVSQADLENLSLIGQYVHDSEKTTGHRKAFSVHTADNGTKVAVSASARLKGLKRFGFVEPLELPDTADLPSAKLSKRLEKAADKIRAGETIRLETRREPYMEWE